jgi:hypothetical protein
MSKFINLTELRNIILGKKSQNVHRILERENNARLQVRYNPKKIDAFHP